MISPPSQDSSHESVHKNDASVPFEDAELASDTAPDNAESSGASVIDNASDLKEAEPNKRIGWFLSPKVWIGLLLLGFIIFVIVDTATTGHVREGVEAFLDWIRDNTVAGFFLFVIGKQRNDSKRAALFALCANAIPAIISDSVSSLLVPCTPVYWVATVFFIPGSILTLGAGFVFSMAFGLAPGVFLGTISVFLGASLGAMASFLLARYLLREQVSRLSSKYAIFQALDMALQENGLKIFVLLRLSPIIPFNAVNYIGGVTAVSFRNYFLALFAILPGTILYVFLGASAGSLADSASSGKDPTVIIIVVAVGAAFGILAIWLTTRYARNELNHALEQRRLEADSEHEEDVEELAVNEDFAGAVEFGLPVDENDKTTVEGAACEESALVCSPLGQ
jgi:uncharacterized membrane protein YdjX (TVP38/TMEM64 family)